MSGAKPNEVVVCIDDKPSRKGQMVLVKKNQFYRVRSVTKTPGAGRAAYTLYEVVDPMNPKAYIPHSQYRFKKIDGDAAKFWETMKLHKAVGGKVKEDA